MNWIDTGTASLRYELRGTRGPAVVLIHEMGGALESWDGVVPALARSRRVLRYDTRGAGFSEALTGDITIEEMADDLLGLLDGLGLREPVAVVGCAVGAAIALSFAARHPARTAAAAVMSPACGIRPEDREARRAFADSVLVSGMRGIVEPSLAGGYPELFRARDRARFETFRARWLCNAPESFRFVYRMLIDLDLSEHYPKIACQVLGIGASYDPVRTPAYVREVIGRIPNHRYVEIESGHHTPVQTPDAVAHALVAFLNEVQPASGTIGGAP